MNTTLPRTSAVTRISSVLAAAFVTLATLGVIDRLAIAEAAAPQLAQLGAPQHA